MCFVPSLLQTRGLVDYLKGYSLQDLERVLGNAWLCVTMHGYDFDRSRPRCYVSRNEMAEALAKVREAHADVGTIPIGPKPGILSPRQERILKGKVLLCRRKLVCRFLPSSGPAESQDALTQVSDGIASLAWKLKMHFKPAF